MPLPFTSCDAHRDSIARMMCVCIPVVLQKRSSSDVLQNGHPFGVLRASFKNLSMGLFLMGCFPRDFQEGKRPTRHSGQRPIKVGKRPIEEGKRPMKANGLFSGTLPWWKTAPLKRPIKRSMIAENHRSVLQYRVIWDDEEWLKHKVVVTNST